MKNIPNKSIPYTQGLDVQSKLKFSTKNRLATVLLSWFFAFTHVNANSDTLPSSTMWAEEAYKNCVLKVSNDNDRYYELVKRKYPQDTSQYHEVMRGARDSYEKSLGQWLLECRKKEVPSTDKVAWNKSKIASYTLNWWDLHSNRGNEQENAALKYFQKNQVHHIAFEFENLISSFEMLESQFLWKSITFGTFKWEIDRILRSIDSVAVTLNRIKPEILDSKTKKTYEDITVLKVKLLLKINKHS